MTASEGSFVAGGVLERAGAVRLLLLDADGVLSDGRYWVGEDGREWKVFHARDGLGIRLAHMAGLEVGILSGRTSPVVERRAAELGMVEAHQGVGDKVAALESLLERRSLRPAEVAYMGDDLVDLGVLKRVGLAIAPADAVVEVRRQAHLITTRPGGAGAVREAVEFILRTQGRWGELVARFRDA
jgi:3-deoxy-D-manno-octulosonate 8-phosphate phosphatase (KDO 8-P phosphatase)